MRAEGAGSCGMGQELGLIQALLCLSMALLEVLGGAQGPCSLCASFWGGIVSLAGDSSGNRW